MQCRALGCILSISRPATGSRGRDANGVCVASSPANVDLLTSTPGGRRKGAAGSDTLAPELPDDWLVGCGGGAVGAGGGAWGVAGDSVVVVSMKVV